MSVATFLDAAARRRTAWDLYWPHRIHRCGLCGYVDARHRVADAIVERLEAGDDPAELAADYNLVWDAHVWAVAFWSVAADRRRHGLTTTQETEALHHLYQPEATP